MKIKVSKFDMPVMATPAVRMVVVTAEPSPPNDRDPDYGCWTIFTTINPVVAIHYVPSKRIEEEPYGAVFLTDSGILDNASWVNDVREAKVFHCPWPPEEDAEQVKDHIATLVEHHKHLLERRIEDGWQPYPGFLEAVRERQAAQRNEQPLRRRGRPRRGGDETPGAGE